MDEKQHTKKRQIGLMGGTFDPIHYGHLVIAEEVRAKLQLAEMVFIPAGQPPHKANRAHTTVEHRVAMVQLAIASNPAFTLSRIEVDRQGPSYLVDTLRLLHEEQKEPVELFFVLGWDSLEDFPGWYNPSGILEQLTHLVAVQRPGYSEDSAYLEQLESRLPGLAHKLQVVSAPQLEISSTNLRQRIVEGMPIKYQTPEAVERYIYENQLYQAKLL